MKRIIKKSTTITEMMVNDNGETFIIDRKHSVKNNSNLITGIIIDVDLAEWKKLDQIHRKEIAKEIEEYNQKNSSAKN